MSKKIFVVDDDPVIRALTTDCIGMLGHSVQSFESGESLLAYIKSSPMPDIVFLDMMMPTLNGVEVLQCLRADPQTKALYVVLLSANNDNNKILESNQVRADAYLQKPFLLKELSKLIDEVKEKN